MTARMRGNMTVNAGEFSTFLKDVVGAFDNGYWFQRFRGDTKGTFYPVPVGNDDFRLDRDGVAVMLTGAASEPTSATPYPTVYFKFEINSGWTNFEGGKGKGLVRCVRE